MPLIDNDNSFGISTSNKIKTVHNTKSIAEKIYLLFFSIKFIIFLVFLSNGLFAKYFFYIFPHNYLLKAAGGVGNESNQKSKDLPAA